MNETDMKLFNEMKENCIKQANYIDSKAMEKYNMLRNVENTINKLKGKNQRTEDVLRQILKYCNYLHNDCKYRLNDGHIRKIRKIIRDYFEEDDNEKE